MPLFKKREPDPMPIGGATCSVDAFGSATVAQEHLPPMTPEAISVLAAVSWAVTVAVRRTDRSPAAVNDWMSLLTRFGDAAAMNEELNPRGVNLQGRFITTGVQGVTGRFMILPTSHLMGQWQPSGGFDPVVGESRVLAALWQTADRLGEGLEVKHAFRLFSESGVDLSHQDIRRYLPQVLMDGAAQFAALERIRDRGPFGFEERASEVDHLDVVEDPFEDALAGDDDEDSLQRPFAEDDEDRLADDGDSTADKSEFDIDIDLAEQSDRALFAEFVVQEIVDELSAEIIKAYETGAIESGSGYAPEHFAQPQGEGWWSLVLASRAENPPGWFYSFLGPHGNWGTRGAVDSLTEIAEAARDRLAYEEEINPDTIEMTIQVELPGAVAESHMTRYHVLQAISDHALTKAAEAAQTAVRSLIDEGMTREEIAYGTGLPHDRVGELLSGETSRGKRWDQPPDAR